MVISRSGKKDAVAKIKKDLAEYPVVAVATLQNLPSRQYNAIKKKLRGKAVIDIARSTLLRRAIEDGRPEVKELEKYFQGSTAIVLTKENPFQLFQTLKASQSKVKAKPGQIAPSDIVVPKGETNLPPGPVLTELKAAGIVAKIMGPKVVIDRDSTVAKKGEVIKPEVAAIMAKLGVEPMSVGLEVLAAFENGTVYTKEILDIDTDAFRDQLVACHQQAVNLAVFAEVFNEVSTPIIIAKAARAANAVNAVVESKKPAAAEPAPQQ